MFAIGIGGALGCVRADNHGSQGGQTGCDDRDGCLDHGDGTGEHGLVLLGVIGSDD